MPTLEEIFIVLVPEIAGGAQVFPVTVMLLPAAMPMPLLPQFRIVLLVMET